MAFKAKAQQHGIHIGHYHADNRCFADNAFREHVCLEEKTLTFCRVNAHWQNGVAEKTLRDVKEGARTMLLHVIGKWPGVITTFLWPQAMRHAVTIQNHTPFKHDNESPIDLFANSKIQPNLKHI